MPLPPSIPVRYTDEEAGFVSVRPVLRMGLRPEQLLELILGVTGKTSERVEQILRSGSVAANGYRYWWDALQVGAGELEPLLAAFPDADPSRPFEATRCILVSAEAGTSTSPLAEFTAPAASRRRTFRRRSFWDALLSVAAQQSPDYRSYSYAHRGDLYALELEPGRGAWLAQEARRLGTAEVRGHAAALAHAARLAYICSR